MQPTFLHESDPMFVNVVGKKPISCILTMTTRLINFVDGYVINVIVV